MCGIGEQSGQCLARRRHPPRAELLDETTHVLQVERGNVREKVFDLTLKTTPFTGIGISPERPQRSLGRARLSKDIFVQVSTEDAPELRER